MTSDKNANTLHSRIDKSVNKILIYNQINTIGISIRVASFINILLSPNHKNGYQKRLISKSNKTVPPQKPKIVAPTSHRESFISDTHLLPSDNDIKSGMNTRNEQKYHDAKISLFIIEFFTIGESNAICA